LYANKSQAIYVADAVRDPPEREIKAKEGDPTAAFMVPKLLKLRLPLCKNVPAPSWPRVIWSPDIFSVPPLSENVPSPP
jgi:hypothetical protein